MTRSRGRVGGLALALAALAATAVPAATSQSGDWGPVEVTKVADGLVQPVDFAFGQDGYAYYVELTGKRVMRVALDSGEIDPEPVAELPHVFGEEFTETGLFGLALHPDFHENGILYASYTKNESGTVKNVLSRIVRGEETVLAERPGGHFHNGGRVVVMNDHIWWSAGDGTNPFKDGPQGGVVAQEDGVMRGKIMRLTLDGEPAPGNAWGDAAWTKGHRNVYGLAWDPENARFLATENGDAKADELNILEAGANYGWPECEGPCEEPRPEFTDPVYAWNGTVAPTGATWFRGAFWFGTFNKGDVHRFSDETGEWALEHVHHYPGNADMPPRVLDVETGPDGASVWFSTWDELWRIDFPDDPDYPPRDALAPGPYWWEHDGSDNGGSGDGGDGTGNDTVSDPDESSSGGIWAFLPGPPIGLALAVLAITACGLARRQRRV